MAPVLRGNTTTKVFQGYWPSTAPVQPRTRVRGSDRPVEAASGFATTSSPRTHWASTCTYGELAPVRPIVTNLRLPGQYDERLFGSLGLQGPYYNWNRWYLPGVGRYLEPDPIALLGGMNGPHTPDWYGYAEGNPLRKTDPSGLDSEMCHRDFNTRVKPPYARHCFIRFDEDDDDTLSFDLGGVHPDPDPAKPGRQCVPAGDDDKDKCIRREMKRCKKWNLTAFNCCHCAEQALKACGISLPVGDWPNWPINPGPQPGEPGYTPDPEFQ